MKRITIVLVAYLVTLLLACKSDVTSDVPFSPKPPGVAVGQGVNIYQVIEERGDILTSARTIVPMPVIRDALGKVGEELEIKDSSPGGPTATHSSCFFKWNDLDFPNAGILLQIMKNPLGDEYPDYIPKFIDSKIVLGEQDIDGEKILFKELVGLGDAGAYSYEAGKYFWRLGDQVILGVAFNSSHSERDQYRIAMTLGREMTQNYIAGE